MQELKPLCCPGLVILAVVALLYFAWALCRIAALSDERKEQDK